MSQQYDVAILGAGPAGSITAHYLATRGYRVVMVDRKKADSNARRVGESLPPAATPLLRHLGLSDILENGPHIKSFGNCSSWASERLEYTDFIRDPQGHGWHLDRAKFDRDLQLRAVAAGATIVQQSMTSSKRDAQLWNLVLDSGESLIAKWVVDASGRAAVFARHQGAQRHKDDGLMALYAWLKPAGSDRETRTLIESAAKGWWYTSRLPDQSRIVVFHSDAQEIARVTKSPALWSEMLHETRYVSKIAKTFELEMDLRCTEATGARMSIFGGENWFAAGDAALSFDPLSSQGLFNAMYSAMKVGQAVDESLRGADSRIALEQYTQRLEEIRAIYLSRRQLFYSSETRWLNEPFWKNRKLRTA